MLLANQNWKNNYFEWIIILQNTWFISIIQYYENYRVIEFQKFKHTITKQTSHLNWKFVQIEVFNSCNTSWKWKLRRTDNSLFKFWWHVKTYDWYKIYFLLFQACYHTPKQKKIKFTPWNHKFSNTGFEIYFYVQLPLGQPQDLVWLPIEYFGCPSSCPQFKPTIIETNMAASRSGSH